jgi:hypothetical protein
MPPNVTRRLRCAVLCRAAPCCAVLCCAVLLTSGVHSVGRTLRSSRAWASAAQECRSRSGRRRSTGRSSSARRRSSYIFLTAANTSARPCSAATVRRPFVRLGLTALWMRGGGRLPALVSRAVLAMASAGLTLNLGSYGRSMPTAMSSRHGCGSARLRTEPPMTSGECASVSALPEAIRRAVAGVR